VWVTNRRCSDVGPAGRRARNRVSGTNSTRMAVDGTRWQLFWRSFLPSRSARRRPGTGAFWGWAERRSLERKPLIRRALCRSIASVNSQPPALDRACRIADLTVKITQSKARPSAAEGSDHLFRDVKSICRRLFIPTALPRRREVGRRPGKGYRRSAHQTTRSFQSGPPVRSRQALASGHPVRTLSALSLYLLQWCDF
jgi:hypothetical protein